MRRHLVAIAAVVLSVATVADAAGIGSVNQSATATQAAVPTVPLIDAVSVFQTGELTTPIRDAALAAAKDVGAPAVVGTGFSAGLYRVRRGAAVIQQARGSGWAFPMSISSLPIEAIGAVMGRQVSGPISIGQVVMGQSTATLRGAQVGDVIDLRASSGALVSYTIGLIAPDTQIGSTEIVMTVAQAGALFGGTALPTRVLIYGMASRSALDTALAARGLTTNSKVRIRHTWDPAEPDSTLSMVRTKQLLGEFDIDYANLSLAGWTAMSPTWVAANLPSSRRSYPTGILARCHNVIHADLTAALQEVVNSGLAGYIDAANANAYGGCATGQARFSRITGNLGSVSRHSWGQPLDTNTVTNCQGCVPKMDCRVVRIFRKHNFAWGGNFLTPDGMHFEWVGERRDTVQFAAKYCPNPVGAAGSDVGADPLSQPQGLAVIFGDDGFADEAHE